MHLQYKTSLYQLCCDCDSAELMIALLYYYFLFKIRLLQSYNSLTDENLARHFSNPRQQKFLQKIGLVRLNLLIQLVIRETAEPVCVQ